MSVKELHLGPRDDYDEPTDIASMRERFNALPGDLQGRVLNGLLTLHGAEAVHQIREDARTPGDMRDLKGYNRLCNQMVLATFSQGFVTSDRIEIAQEQVKPLVTYDGRVYCLVGLYWDAHVEELVVRYRVSADFTPEQVP